MTLSRRIAVAWMFLLFPSAASAEIVLSQLVTEIKAGYAALGRTCKACHESYRADMH